MTENYAKDQHYVGNFHVLDENIAGEIVYNKERGVILLNLAKTCQDPNTALKSYGTLSLITGKLNTGAVVTLFDNRRIIDNSINFRMKQLVFSASYMIWSNSESLVPEYDKMICVLKNAYSWSGLTAFRSTHEGIRLIEPFEQKTCHWFNAKLCLLHRSIIVCIRLLIMKKQRLFSGCKWKLNLLKKSHLVGLQMFAIVSLP